MNAHEAATSQRALRELLKSTHKRLGHTHTVITAVARITPPARGWDAAVHITLSVGLEKTPYLIQLRTAYLKESSGTTSLQDGTLLGACVETARGPEPGPVLAQLFAALR